MRRTTKALAFVLASAAGAGIGATVPASASNSCCECQDQAICSAIEVECRLSGANSHCDWVQPGTWVTP